jgi:Integrase core domain
VQLQDEDAQPRFLIRDRDGKFSRDFDEVFRSAGIRVIKAPVRAPQARAHAERWVGSLRRECLDRLLIVGRRHLARVVAASTSHYNEHRPRRSLDQRPPLRPATTAAPLFTFVRRLSLVTRARGYQIAPNQARGCLCACPRTQNHAVSTIASAASGCTGSVDATDHDQPDLDFRHAHPHLERLLWRLHSLCGRTLSAEVPRANLRGGNRH